MIRPLAEVSGKGAFITGGASGIGLGIADACARAGMRVVIADLRPDHIEDALASLEGCGEVHALELDVCDRDAFAAAVTRSRELVGNVHLLVGNAGMGIGGPITMTRFDDWDWGISVLIGGVVNAILSFLPQMLEHGEGGQIVSTASMAGLLPVPRTAIYSMAKAAVIGLSETIREELSEQGIGVSAFCPGPVQTNIRETGRTRPQRYRGDSGLLELEASLEERPNSPLWMDPIECGQRVLAGVRANDLYILTHREFKDGIAERFDAILASFPDEEVDEARAAEIPFLLRSRVFSELLEERGGG
ncbi:MAG TPA: SDR family NAD(P)-dependent oxidoreductase [Solirubrobacteraceae bacterium]|nr:SDR family NAD(P)-dependent oxidoreductase [Solirubrobacteraceae bacterium]